MSEIIVRSRIEIEASTAEAWAVVADHGYDMRWREDVERVSHTPAGLVAVGTRIVEHGRSLDRRRTIETVVGSVVPEHRFTWSATSGADAEGSRMVTAARPGFVWVEQQFVVRSGGMFARLMRPLRQRSLQHVSDRSLQRLEVLFDRLSGA